MKNLRRILLLSILILGLSDVGFAQLKVKDQGSIAIGTEATSNAKINVDNTSSTREVGLRMNHNYTGTSVAYGILNKSILNGDLAAVGFRNELQNLTNIDGDKDTYGIQNNVLNLGSGETIGIYSVIGKEGSTRSKYGIYNRVTESLNAVGVTRGIYSLCHFDGPRLSYGFQNITYVSATSMGGKYGVYTRIQGKSGALGTGSRYAFYSKINSTAANHYAGYFAGNVLVTGTFTNPSDVNFKQNIKMVGNSLEVIMKLVPKKYQFKKNVKNMSFPEGDQYGLIAQEVESVLPELVKKVKMPVDAADNEEEIEEGLTQKSKQQTTELESYKTLNYQALIPLLIGAVKEQQEIINKMSDRIKRLEGGK